MCELLDSGYSVLRAISIRTAVQASFSLTAPPSLVSRGSPDTHTLPFDKLRPQGNKIAVVGTGR